MVSRIGVDIELVKRFKKRGINNRFFESVFTKAEREYCERKKEPPISYAGKFCAKEAVIKCFGKKMHIKEIEIINNKDGKPEVWIKGKLNKKVKCSISHCKDYAVAFAVVNKDEK